jgi:hypothetical protein
MALLSKLLLNFRSVHGKYLCAEGGGGRELVANRERPDQWESFTVDNTTGGVGVQHGDRIALRARNGKWVYANNGGGEQLLAMGGPAIGAWEPLTVHNLDSPGGSIVNGTRAALQAVNGQFVYAEPGGRVVAAGPAIGGWEPFTIELFSFSWWRSAHGRFLCAEGGGGRELVANRDIPDTWERFRFHHLDGWPLQNQRRCALRANGWQYVYANNGGGEQLLAKGPAIGGWEPLRVHVLENPMTDVFSVAIQTVNGQFVYAEPGGRVVAAGPAIGDWEPFRMTFPLVLVVG